MYFLSHNFHNIVVIKDLFHCYKHLFKSFKPCTYSTIFFTDQDTHHNTLDTLPHLLFVLDELVHLTFSTRDHKVSIENRLVGHHLLESVAKLLNVLLQEPIKPVPVLGAHQPILKDAAALVVPQLQQLDLVL